VPNRPDTPVFCDQSGVRSVVVQWGGRSIGLLLLLLCAGLALTLQTRVEVPGLSRLLPPGGNGLGELYRAPSRWNGANRQPVSKGNVVVPSISNQTVAGVPDLSLPKPKPSSAVPTGGPTVERPTVARVHPTSTTPVTSSSVAPSLQSSPSQSPSPTATPTAGRTSKPRNPHAAVPRENSNAQGSTNAPGQEKVKVNGKGKAGSAPPPKTGTESTTP
jgi:hypothetical protein